jgi:hypothetical protein
VATALDATQRLSGTPGEISMVAVSIAPGHREADVEGAIERRVPGTLAIGDPSEVARVDTNSRIITKAGIIIAVLAVLLGAVVAINTMAMATIERRREFGILGAIGWGRARIARLILRASKRDLLPLTATVGSSRGYCPSVGMPLISQVPPDFSSVTCWAGNWPSSTTCAVAWLPLTLTRWIRASLSAFIRVGPATVLTRPTASPHEGRDFSRPFDPLTTRSSSLV